MKLDLKKLQAAINRVTSVFSVKGENIYFMLENKILNLSMDAGGHAMKVKIPFDDADQWQFALDPDTLNGVFKGRAQLDMKVENGGTRVKFSSGKSFEADFATQPYSLSADLEKSEAKKITDEQQDQLMLALDLASLPPIHEQDTNFIVKIGPKASYVACFDDLHFALVESPGVKGDPLEFVFPTSTFTTIAKAAAKGRYQMSSTSAAICAWNKEFELLVPFVQQDVQQTIDDVRQMAGSFGKGMAIIGKKELVAALEAASVAIEDGDPVTLQIVDKGLVLTGSSNKGSITERVQCKVSKIGTMELNMAVTMNIMRNVPNGPVEIGVHDGRFLFVRAVQDEHKVTYGGMLNG